MQRVTGIGASPGVVAGRAVILIQREQVLRYRVPWLPVVDEDGHLLGIARQDRAQASIDAGEAWLTISAALESGQAPSWQVREDRPISELLSSEMLGRLGALPAVDAEGILRGVVTVDQVRRALRAAATRSMA